MKASKKILRLITKKSDKSFHLGELYNVIQGELDELETAGAIEPDGYDMDGTKYYKAIVGKLQNA